ncbi:MAG: response regulator transcription factor [Christensenellales bacterium]|jgi:two-component system response regulator YesN
MYRVLIVDDEPWALLGVRKFIEQCENAFEIISETTNPLLAYETLCEKKPDLVITDIRMPVITGLELMRRAREKNLPSSFVVVSGIADFSYVQEALREGAIDYLLKPLNMQKAPQILQSICQKLASKFTSGDILLFSDLLNGTGQEQLKRRFFKAPYANYQAVTVCYKQVPPSGFLLDLGEDAQCVDLRVGQRKFFYIINSAQDKTEQVERILLSKPGLVDYAGSSNLDGDIKNISRLIRNAETASYGYFIEKEKRISRYSKPKVQSVNHLCREIIDGIEAGQHGALQQRFSQLPEVFCRNEMTVSDAVILCNTLALHSVDFMEQNQRLADIEVFDAQELIERFCDLKELCCYLMAQFSSDDSADYIVGHEKFGELIAYINNHYTETLYLKDLSRQFYFNISYCCEMFRKTMGMTFSQYVTGLRIKRACMLLQNSLLSISDICEQAGYNDYFYFNKVFKRNIGYTPAEYRRRPELWMNE